MTDMLDHSGILGMRWGRRKAVRVSVADAQKKNKQTSKKPETPKKQQQPKNPEAVKNQTSDAINKLNKSKGVLDASGATLLGAAKVHETVTNIKSTKQSRREASRMSDDELSKMIRRMSLEQSYASLRSKDLVAGQERVRNALVITGNMVNLAGSITGLASNLKQLKKS